MRRRKTGLQSRSRNSTSLLFCDLSTGSKMRSRFMRSRFLLIVLVAAFLSGCASLPPGSDFPKTTSSALAHSEQTRFGRQFADAAREYGGNSGFRMLAVGVDGFLTRVQMVNIRVRPPEAVHR